MQRPPIVLVHGAWGGAWIWRRVLGPLRAAGHAVHAVTLTGDGERAHLRHPGIRLAAHVDDVVALVQAEELSDVVLVGPHSAEVVAARTATAKANDHALPPPDPIDFGITGADRTWLQRRQVPHPERVRALPGFGVLEMQTGHCPMVTEPQQLVRHLLALAAAPQ